MQLGKNINLYAFSGSTGATSVNVEVDTANYEGAFFVGTMNTSGTAGTLTISTAASTTAAFVNVSGGTASSTGGVANFHVDVYKPRKRWLKGTLTTTAAAGMHVKCYLYGPRKMPVTWTSTGILTSLVSPDT